MMKIDSGEVDGYQSYFDKTLSRSPEMALQVAENRQVLLAVEQAVKPEAK